MLWTEGALISDWVSAEANTAFQQGKLVNVRPPETSFSRIPQPFNIHHIDEARDHEGILATIAKIWKDAPVLPSEPLDESYFRQHGRRIVEAKQEKLAADARRILPSQLLQARHAVTPYIDATGAKADCVAWSLSGERAAGRLIHGPGGLGKTRLMIETAAELRERGWTAGFFDHAHEQDADFLKQRWEALKQRLLHGGDAGLLLVVDNAEGGQQEIVELATLLAAAPEERPLRLVLLARSGGDWWERLRDGRPELQRLFLREAADAGVQALQPIVSAKLRRALFEEAIRKFWPILAKQGVEKPSQPPTPERLKRILTGEGFERPLAIQMEALLWLCSAPTSGDGIDGQLDAVLGLEHAHWKKLAGPLDDDARCDMVRGAAQVTAVAGADSEAATRALLMADDYKGRRIPRVDVAPALRNLTRVYGWATGGAGPIEPGLLGEHHVAGIADDELIEGCLVWIETQSEAGRERRRRDLITLLQRATLAEHGAKASAKAVARLDYLILRHMPALAADLVAVMAETPGQLQSRIEAALDVLDFEALRALDLALAGMRLQLPAFANSVSPRHAFWAKAVLEKSEPHAAAADGHEFPRNRAADAFNLDGVRLCKLEKREEDIERRLAGSDVDVLPDLADRLYNPGCREEALAITKEDADIRRAVALHRRLAETQPDAFLPGLAMSLNNLGERLSVLGRWEEALEASQEATDIGRRLAEGRPDAFLPDLARSLNNLGAMFSHLGRGEEALAATQEAVDIRRRLAEARPEAFLPDLAVSLSNLGDDLFNFGRREEALAAGQGAVDIQRRLAESRPDVLPDLAMSLNNLGNMLAGLGRREEALAASREATDAQRRLADSRPDAFLPGLAASLSSLSVRLSDLCHFDEALAASQEAVDIERRLAESRPDALSNLAGSLNNLGVDLFNLGRREEALAVTQKAVDIRRRLAESTPDAFLPGLAMSLINLGLVFSELGLSEEGLEAGREAVEVHRRLAEIQPGVFLPGLAMSLNNLGERLSGLERWEGAVAASQEAADIYRRLAEARPDAFLPDLANSLGTLGLASTGQAQHLDAAGALKEALEIVAPFVEKLPHAFSQLSAKLLKAYAPACQAAGVEADASLLERLEGQAPDSRQTQSKTL